MSKASEFVAARQRAKRPECVVAGTRFWVDVDGNLCVANTEHHSEVPSTEVAALTAWLIDTFGERVTA